MSHMFCISSFVAAERGAGGTGTGGGYPFRHKSSSILVLCPTECVSQVE